MSTPFPRLTNWLIVAIVMLIGLFFVSPQQLDVVLYKIALICLAAVAGYWLDRSLFPYARPDGYLKQHWRLGTEEPEDQADYEIVEGYILPFVVATIRRATIILAVIIGVALGL